MLIDYTFQGGIMYNDKLYAIAPQHCSMGMIWGMRYSWHYNRDVTKQWTHVIGGMY